MTETRKIFIKSLISGLKIDVDRNPFEYQAVVDGAESIKENDFMDFYNECRKINTYGDGVKAIMETAEQFNVQVQVNPLQEKAKELIGLVASMNESIYQQHIETGERFEDLLKAVSFPTVDDETIAILNHISPYYDHKSLIANINVYQTSIEQLHAFEIAISQPSVTQLNNAVEKLRIGKG